MPRKRKVGSATAPVDDEFATDREVETRMPLDPAMLVAEEMLTRALGPMPGIPIAIGGPVSLAVVRTPSAEWTKLASQAWGAMIQCGAESADGCREIWRGRESWLTFTRPDAESRTRDGRDNGDESVAQALWRGKSVAGFSPDPEALLPRDLVHGADHRIEMIGPTPDDVTRAARRLSESEPTFHLVENEAAALTPRLLRLARRPDQGADAFIAKLRDLLARERAAVVETPRAAPRDAPTLDRLHGMDEAVVWGNGVARDLKAFAAKLLPWSRVDGQGCLLSGPPGCGKTLFARALAATCGVPLVTGSYGAWLATGSGHQGDMLRAMRRTFADARTQKPCILFIDEADSFPNRSTLPHDRAEWDMQVVNALLAEIDGVEGREGVVLVAACNHPEKLDPALVRSGRLDRHVRMRLPDQAALACILREHLGADLTGEPLSSAALAAAGASGADCERFVRGARRRAREAGRAMTLADLMGEIGGTDGRTDAELWVVAIHEAGHALALCELQPGALKAVTLSASGQTLGTTRSAMSGGYVYAADVQQRLVLLLAGRAAEEVVLGAPSSGAGGGADSDLAVATKLAVTAAAALGLDGASGLVWSGVPDTVNLPRMLVDDAALKARVRATLDEAYGDAVALVRRRRAALEGLAAALLERRALDGAEAAAIVALFPGDTP